MSILNFALQLDMKAVAEGVENAEDWAFLRTTQCHITQGYFIARHMSAELRYRHGPMNGDIAYNNYKDGDAA